MCDNLQPGNISGNTSGNANLLIGAFNKASQETGAPRDAPGDAPGVGAPGTGCQWRSRGYLPHFESDMAIQHVTFHLADGLPKMVLERLEEEIRSLSPDKKDVERRKLIEASIDAGYGSCILKEPTIAAMVENTLLFFEGQRYSLVAWVVMPNHIHVLFQPMNGWSVAKIVASWKKFTARRIFDCLKEANQEIGAPGIGASRIWHREYWDRAIRNDRHFQQAREYIHLNPVKAGLVSNEEDWPWSSASKVIGKANQEIGAPRGGAPGSGVTEEKL
jgi:putative transposase